MSKKFNLKQDSLDFGKSTAFFSVLKKTNPVLFRYCVFYSKRTLSEGYQKLINYYDNLKQKLQDIYFSFKHPYSFWQWLSDKSFYAAGGAAQSIDCIFNTQERINVDFLYKMKAIIKFWNKQND